MAARTHGFTGWLAALTRLLGLTAPPPKPDYSLVSIPDLDARIAYLDEKRTVHLDAAEDLQFGIEVLLEEKACRLHGADHGLKSFGAAPPAAYA